MKKLEVEEIIKNKGSGIESKDVKIVSLEIEEKDIMLKDCIVSYREDSAFSKFLIGYDRIDATTLPLILELPPIETLIHEKNLEPEHDKKFIYKAAKILIVVKIEKSFYGPAVGNEIQERVIHAFVDGVEFHDKLGELNDFPPTNYQEKSENYVEITVYETKEHQLKRMWIETKSHRQGSSSDSCHEVNVMIEIKDGSMFRGMIEVEDAKKFLASIFYNESFCND